MFSKSPRLKKRDHGLRSLTEQYGNSALDFFKTYSDKFIYAPPDINAFISYRVSRNFAVVLEDPVSENREEMKKCIVIIR